MNSDRGQAFTLEGFIASIVVLTAILFALEAVVITPTTSGAVDQEVQSQLRTEGHDILRVSSHNGSDNLTHWVRYWNGSESEDTFAGAQDPVVGYGSQAPFYLDDSAIGTLLNESFTQRGRVYNVIVEYRNATNPNESEEIRVVYQGVPSDNAIVTKHTVALFDNMTLTGPDADGRTLEAYDTNPDDGSDGYYPIPDAFGQDDDPNGGLPDGHESDSPLYNIVEIRVIVW